MFCYLCWFCSCCHTNSILTEERCCYQSPSSCEAVHCKLYILVEKNCCTKWSSPSGLGCSTTNIWPFLHSILYVANEIHLYGYFFCNLYLFLYLYLTKNPFQQCCYTSSGLKVNVNGRNTKLSVFLVPSKMQNFSLIFWFCQLYPICISDVITCALYVLQVFWSKW